MNNERLLNLAALQVEYERTIDRDDERVARSDKMNTLTKLCAKFECSYKEFQYLERCLVN
jgi:hypothetical protein